MLVVSLCLVSSVARADDKVAAEELFLKGKELKKEGKLEEACDAFDRSNRLDPQIGTQYNLALCYEELGRLASAWGLFREVAQKDTKAARRKDADEHARKLKPRLTKMLITLEGPTVPGLVVTRDLEDVTATVGIESAVDPGDYTLIASAPGFKQFTTEIRASGEGATVTVMIPILEEEIDGEVTPEEEPPRGHEEDDPEIDFTRQDGGGGGGGRKKLGLIVAGSGRVVAITGGVFGVMAKGDWDDAKAICGGDQVCDNAEDEAAADDLAAGARTKGNISTALVGVGTVALAAGVVLWLTAPSGGGHGERALVPTATHDSVGLAFWRTF